MEFLYCRDFDLPLVKTAKFVLLFRVTVNMPVCMYPAVIAPERNIPNYVAHGESVSGLGVRQGSAVVPGEMIFSSGANLITGHGTYRDMDVDMIVEQWKSVKTNDNQPSAADEAMRNAPMRTSLTGRVRIVNKLVYVEPPKARYSGNVGDTVVGRIVEVNVYFSRFSGSKLIIIMLYIFCSPLIHRIASL